MENGFSNINNIVHVMEHNFFEQEKRFWQLKDLNSQILQKTAQLDWSVENMTGFGLNILEPWRMEVSSLLQRIIRTVQELEVRSNGTVNGCVELDRRIEILANELINLKNENEHLREEISELKRNGIEKTNKIEEEIVKESSTRTIMQNEIRDIKIELNYMKVITEWELSRLESLVIERLLINHKTNDQILKTKVEKATQIDLEELRTFVVPNKGGNYSADVNQKGSVNEYRSQVCMKNTINKKEKVTPSKSAQKFHQDSNMSHVQFVPIEKRVKGMGNIKKVVKLLKGVCLWRL